MNVTVADAEKVFEFKLKIISTNNGFPYAWKAGRIEYLIKSMLETKAHEQLAVDLVMIINATWLQDTGIIDDIKKADPDFIICYNFADPMTPEVYDQIKSSGVPHVIIGSCADYRLDFWAMVCDLHFQHYDEEQIRLDTETSRHYVCYNRKPHPHRVWFVDALAELEVASLGHISLGLPGDAAMVIDEAFSDEQGIKDEYSNLNVDEIFVSKKIRNDIFSLGNLSIWNKIMMCFVTETEFNNSNPNNFFISEKTWKPILGLRPFLVVGQAPLRQYLKDSGFDIFEDLFDYYLIDESKQFAPAQAKMYAQVAKSAIDKIAHPSNEYYHYYADRCRNNRIRFYQYVYEQWHRLHALDLNKYV